MIDVSELLTDPDFCQPGAITITRLEGRNVDGYFQTTPSSFETIGIIRPASTEDIKMLPEGDRVEGMIIIYTSVQLFGTRKAQPNAGGLSDEVTWQGENYKVVQAANYSQFGYYKSMAERKLGA